MARCDNIRFAVGGTAVEIIDQTLLPGALERISLETLDECCDAIGRLAVRGAPAIGIFAAFALAALAQGMPSEGPQAFDAAFVRASQTLRRCRPTAVNLAWATERMEAVASRMLDAAPPDAQGWARQHEALLCALRAEALAIQEEDVQVCTRIAELGLGLVEDGMGIITHCNAGALATSAFGTALGVPLLGAQRGVKLHVYADETRPLLQGARLTTYELMQAGVEVTLICDNMAATVMSQGKVDACFVGCDRVAANGDVANKVGTNGLAIIAAHYGVPFYVMCPTSTLDMACPSGDHIPIELRDPSEIHTLHFAQPMAPEGVQCYNPAFDVTDASLVSAIVTERGIARPPYAQSLAGICGL